MAVSLRLRKSKNNDEAVSPVIAVILMVAITVVLAATVYVWVSGFSNNSNNASASISIVQVGVISGTSAQNAKFTITSVSSGFEVQNLKAIDATNGKVYALGGDMTVLDDGVAGAFLTGTSKLAAGDVIVLALAAGETTMPDGSVLQLVDTLSNNVIASVYTK